MKDNDKRKLKLSLLEIKDLPKEIALKKLGENIDKIERAAAIKRILAYRNKEAKKDQVRYDLYDYNGIE